MAYELLQQDGEKESWTKRAWLHRLSPLITGACQSGDQPRGVNRKHQSRAGCNRKNIAGRDSQHRSLDEASLTEFEVIGDLSPRIPKRDFLNDVKGCVQTNNNILLHQKCSLLNAELFGKNVGCCLSRSRNTSLYFVPKRTLANWG